MAPASARFANEFYDTDEEMLSACAEALREEYKAIIDTGLILQLDDPARDSVIASTDCGLGGRVHPQIAWAKLEALSEGAAVATKRLYA